MASFINLARICVTTTQATLSRHRVPALRAMYHTSKQLGNNRDIMHPNADEDVPIPKPKVRMGETLDEKKARLLYQSRKRGMLENGLLLSTFAYKYLDILTERQLQMYDDIINLPSNDWDIYYWIIGKQTAPEEYQNEVMTMMQEFAKNRNMESRIAQPELKSIKM